MAEIIPESQRIQPGVTHALFVYAADSHPAFGLYNLDKRVFEATHHPSNKLPEFATTPAWQDVYASIPTPFYTLVSSATYKPSEKKNYLEALFGELPEGEIREHPTLIQQRVFVYLEEPRYTHTLQSQFNQLKISSGFANMITAQESLIHDTPFYFSVHCEEDTFLLTVFINGKLSLFNHFQGQKDKDVLYFVSLAAQQLSLELSTVELIVSGKDTNDNVAFLKSYVKNCRSLSQQLENSNLGSIVPLESLRNRLAPLTLAPLCA